MIKILSCQIILASQVVAFSVMVLPLYSQSGLEMSSELREAQKQRAEQILYINSKDSVTRFGTVSLTNNNINYIPSRTYYWYKANTVLKTMGGADGRLLDGEYACFFPNNNLKEKGTFRMGLKDGTSNRWLDNGHIKELTTWKKGVLHGCHIIYDADGKILQTSEKYKNGALQEKKQSKLWALFHRRKKMAEEAQPDNHAH